MSSSPTKPRTITKAEFIAENVEKMFAAFFSRPPQINYDAYLAVLDGVPVENLRRAFKLAHKSKYCPTAVELLVLADYRPTAQSIMDNKSPAQSDAERTRNWDTILTRCFGAEKARRGIHDLKDPVNLLDSPDVWGDVFPNGIMVRTQCQEFKGYAAFREALKMPSALSVGHGVLFLTLESGKLEWVPVRFDNVGDKLAVFHAGNDYPDHFPRNEKPLF